MGRRKRMTTRIRRLSEVIDIIETLPWDQALYLKGTPPWQACSPCAVLDPDEFDALQNRPLFSDEHELHYALSIQTVQDIVANAKAQKPDVDLAGLIEALNYYYRNDAFMKL